MVKSSAAPVTVISGVKLRPPRSWVWVAMDPNCPPRCRTHAVRRDTDRDGAAPDLHPHLLDRAAAAAVVLVRQLAGEPDAELPAAGDFDERLMPGPAERELAQ